TWAVRQRFLTDCYLFYRHRNGSPPEFRERLYAMLEEHARISSRPGRVYLRGIYNNHQVMLSHSLLYAAVKCPELNIDREEVVRRLRDQINNIFTGNGVTREHSADYQLYNLGITIDCYNLMKEAQLDVRELGDILTRSQEFIAYLILPDYTMPAFGDSRVPYPLEAAHRLARTLDDPANELVRVLDKGGGLPLRYETILWPQANIAVIRQFDRRKSLVHLLFMASHFGVTHKHDDDLSFTFYGNGRRFLIDTGYDDLIVHDARKKQLISDYDKPVAHNVVIARGVSWSNRNLTGLTRLTGYGKSSSAVILQGEHHRIPGVRLQRTLFLFEELNLFVIDRISSDTSQDFSQLFHIDPGLILTEKDSSYLCTAADPDFEGIITPLTPCDRQIIHRGVNAKPRSYVFRNREIVNTATIELIRKARQECEMITLIQIVPPSTRKTDTLSKPEIRLENDTVYLKYKQNKRYHEHQLRLRKIDSTEPIRLP
ncbi:MAG: heparinase II/III family protein, partial [Candidatus Krumholzibacteriota bacterium]|nr:heparinase II/III family protein [Candidatus Krumholzibacteriota bacterium]